jgi:hypothetical protein
LIHKSLAKVNGNSFRTANAEVGNHLENFHR